MKQIAFMKIGDTEFESEINEWSLELFPTKENTQILDEINMSLGREISFAERHLESLSLSADLDIDDNNFYQKYIAPHKKFSQATLLFDGYIDIQKKQMFQELQNNGWLFNVQFRQRVYPKLQAEISFLTIFTIEG
jgi:hypothetical protein